MPGVTGMNAQTEKMSSKPAQQRHGPDNDENVELEVEMDDAEHEVDDVTPNNNSNNKPKKKRRIIKTSDKKYDCPQPDCGKSYSRAEHLYRHQLNHTPKQIYRCDFPGCDRHFVRADLCARHKERHTAKGSHLQRKDAFMNSQRAAVANQNSNGYSAEQSGPTTATMASPVDSAHPRQQPSLTKTESYVPPANQAAQPSYDATGGQYHSQQPPNQLPPLQMQQRSTNDPQVNGGPNNAYGNTYNGSGAMLPPTSPVTHRRYSIDGQYERPNQTSGYGQPQHLPMHPPTMSTPVQNAPIYSQPQYSMPASERQLSQAAVNDNYQGHPLPGLELPHATYLANGRGTSTGNVMSPSTMSGASQYELPNGSMGGITDFGMFDQMAASGMMPVFSGDGFHRSPQGMFEGDLLQQWGLPTEVLDMNNMDSPQPLEYYHSQIPSVPMPKTETDDKPEDAGDKPPKWEDNISPTINGMDLSMRESIITEVKQARLIAMVHSFPEIPRPNSGPDAARTPKGDILAGDTNDDKHPLSVKMLKTYITSYWLHIHHQMPIMHRPTFNPETCPDLLLLTMTCLGACCLERTHPAELIKNCAELAFFCAYHIRWEIFKDVEFQPPAKLWTFQTMLLLELFEKMYSTRALHERAHIHHATTLTVMRRGSSLMGRSVVETPSGSGAAPAKPDPTRTPPGPDGSINTSGVNTQDAWWNRWITAEATRRVAYAAFIIDSTHAMLFGHSANMSPHDIRLPLPCDEDLWSATSSAEVQMVERVLNTNGFKSMSFLEGLKATLHGHPVRTNIFGRVVLMAGLLSMSWHQNTRDLSISSMGATTTLGIAPKWRTHFTRAYDHWRRDFEEDQVGRDTYRSQANNADNKSRCHKDHGNNVFESKSCLHTLAHVAMHVDIVDCEVYAGSERALGRQVVESDRTNVKRKMKEWAPSARARDAVFYAIKFLCEVLLPRPGQDEAGDSQSNGMSVEPMKFTYSARDDYLLNRPWIVYFAVMTVWAYGYTLDGAINDPTYAPTTRAQQFHDLREYLIRVGSVSDPGDLESMPSRNRCLGLLMLLKECFNQPRWELLHEAADNLQLCIERLLPGDQEAKRVPT